MSSKRGTGLVRSFAAEHLTFVAASGGGDGVSAYLDMAELQAMRRIPMTMADWEKRLSAFLTLCDPEVLQDAGKVSAELAKTHAENEFEAYRITQDRTFESDFDRVVKAGKALEQTGPARGSAERKKNDEN